MPRVIGAMTMRLGRVKFLMEKGRNSVLLSAEVMKEGSIDCNER
jgi:hypothetical protein